MIWYESEIEFLEQPEGVAVRIIGEYRHNEIPSIQVLVHIDDKQFRILEETPSGLTYEEPTPEQVFNKYRNKLSRCVNKVKNQSYQAFLNRNS